MLRGPAAACVLLLLARTATAAEIAILPLEPTPPSFRPDVAAELARVVALIDGLAPPEAAPGMVEVIAAEDSPGLRKSFIDSTRQAARWSGRAIRVAGGSWPLGTLAATLKAPDLLSCADAVCELRAPLLVEPDAELHIGAGAGSAELRLSQAHGAFLASYGLLAIRHATLSGRGPDGSASSTDGTTFRPFLLVYDAGRLVIAASRLAHLGYDAPSAYGVTLTTTDRGDRPEARPSALIHESSFEDLYYGFYSHAAKGVDIVESRYIDSIRYGIDPHDGTADMLIAGNMVQGTRMAHGIVASRRVADLIVHGNRSTGNAGSGIVLDRGVTRAAITDNLTADNGGDGITLYESHEVTVAGNRIVDNARSGIRLRQSAEVWIARNSIAGNRRHGLEASNRTPEREANAEEAGFARPVALTLAGNRFDANRESACTFKGIARLDLVPSGPGLPCGGPDGLAGDREWLQAISAAAARHEPLRLEAR